MALPRSREARAFYRVAKQRFDDAQFLLQGGRTTIAVYLAGYSVECMLKALILSRVRERQQSRIVASFRAAGSKAHDLGWLKAKYLRLGGPPLPAEIVPAFARVNTWTTSMRYRPGGLNRRDAFSFLDAAATIVKWADERL